MSDEDNVSSSPELKSAEVEPSVRDATEVTPQHIDAEASPVPPLDTIIQTPGRTDLLLKARAFLTSPQIAYQSIDSKRSFLREKGLNDFEIEGLLRQLPSQIPNVPPRTYPQPPPSNLPVLLLGLARLYSWFASGSFVLLLIYHRFLLPRITQTSLARQSLKAHHISLLRRFTTSLSALKESQAESFAVLPRSEPFAEPEMYTQCDTVSDVLKLMDQRKLDFPSVPPVTILRCSIFDLGKSSSEGMTMRPSTDELFRYLEESIPWLLSEGGSLYEERLWETLTSCPLFSKIPATSKPVQTSELGDRWDYCAPTPSPLPPLTKSLKILSDALPRQAKKSKNSLQHTLQSLSDFTGYISTEVYLPYRSPTVNGTLTSNQSSIEDEFRREIRALKGLVLNRRSFMPTLPKSPFTSVQNHVAP